MQLWSHALGRMNKICIRKHPAGSNVGIHMTPSLMINENLIFQE